MMNIAQILEKAPAKIAEYAEKENEAYALMINKHEEHKRIRAKKYLEKRAREGSVTIKDIEYELDSDSELLQIKDAELLAEINYRAWRIKKNKVDDLLQSAMERGRNIRSEIRGLNNTINE